MTLKLVSQFCGSKFLCVVTCRWWCPRADL